MIKRPPDLFTERGVCLPDEPEGDMQVRGLDPRHASVWSTLRDPPLQLIDGARHCGLNIRTHLDGDE